MHAPGDIASKALELPEKERADLALRLLESLGPETDMSDDEWLQEIERRADRVFSGKSAGNPADEVYQRARERLKS